ncbi:hypothetical protein EIP86_009503 [Pleurotus ostreatoroseus]|nr:hypothetical protein EIP86_009503 [Pleurotus ostreatoroseus]
MSISARSFVVGVTGSSDPVSRASRRVIVHADVLKAAKILAGDVLALSEADKTTEQKKVGVVQSAPELSFVPVTFTLYIFPAILVSNPVLLTARVKEGAKVQLHALAQSKLPAGTPSLRQAQEARTVRMREITASLSKNLPGSEKGKRRDWLPLLIREALGTHRSILSRSKAYGYSVDLKYLTPTQRIDVIYEGVIRQFELHSVSTQMGPQADAINALSQDLEKLDLTTIRKIWTVSWDSFVVIVDEMVDKEEPKPSHPQGVYSDVTSDAYSNVGGLDKQIAQIRDLVELPLTRPELFRHLGSSVIIINGPELSSAYHGETESKLRDVFAKAREQSPCIVVLDEVDALCPRREDGPGSEVEKRVVAQLLTIMDGMQDESQEGKDRVVVVATTNRPNAIDPALRRPGRFDREIEIGVPDAEARLSILNVLLAKTPHAVSEAELRILASRAHGYVGADLSAVVREAGTIAIKRWFTASSAVTGAMVSPQPVVVMADLTSALTSVRPSALRSIFLDTVPVRYADIGGQAATIQKLRECVDWPLLHPDAFERLGVKAPKGVLLYGPPGCSKTLLVRACATESGVNFVAVKGAELLNKYVGESERAVREIFRKARSAAPSIIFFDEIDAIATSRSSGDFGGGAHEGVLTSLLNEMDGVQELVGVTVVAATNRPDVIDSALMRPGRLDRILYVGPPDFEGRKEILRIITAKMSVQSGLDIEELAQITDGCSGAEIAALCQEAALLTMKENIQSREVSYQAFYAAAKGTKKQITSEVVEHYRKWSEHNGTTEV